MNRPQRNALERPTQRSALCVLPFFISALAGCTTIGLGPNCTFTVPQAHAGDTFVYDGTGTAFLEFWTSNAVVDWNAVDRSSQEEGNLQLLEGSRIAIAISPKTAHIIGMDGQQHSAYQVTTWAHVPPHPNPVDVFDQWIDAENGNTLAMTHRHPQFDERGEFHQTVYSTLGRPPLLFAPMFWGQKVVSGAQGTLQVPHEVYDPRELTYDSVRHEVGDVGLDDRGSCVADVTFDYVTQSGGKSHHVKVVATFSNTSALPIRFREFHPPEYGQEDLDLSLQASMRGDGPAVPPFAAANLPSSGLPLKQPQFGFLPEQKPVFPTRAAAALDAIRQDKTAGGWLQDHPKARLSTGQHAMGEPGGPIVDQWSFTWVDSAGDRIAAHATMKSLLGTGLMKGITVTTSPAENRPFPPAFDSLVAIEGLSLLHRQVYRSAPEVLLCWMDLRMCWMGTHNSTGVPRVSEGGAGGAHISPALLFWMDKGLLLQDQSWDPTSVRGPVKPPAGWYRS